MVFSPLVNHFALARMVRSCLAEFSLFWQALGIKTGIKTGSKQAQTRAILKFRRSTCH
jgi:hypothetical protein